MASPVTCVCKIQVPGSRATHQFPLMYQGCMIPSSDNIFIFPAQLPVTFSIVVTLGTVVREGPWSCRERLMRDPRAPTRWFDCALTLDEHDMYAWRITELQAHEMPVLLPDHACIVGMNPTLLDSLVPPSRTRYCHAGNGQELWVLELPRIRLKRGLTQDMMRDACAEGFCASLQLRCFHDARRLESMQMQNVCCSRTRSRYAHRGD